MANSGRGKRDNDLDDDPMGGEPEGGGVAIVRSGDGAVAVPVAIRNLRGDALWTFGRLQQDVVKRAEMGEGIRAHVLALREFGVSWASVSWALGTTPDAARKRYTED